MGALLLCMAIAAPTHASERKLYRQSATAMGTKWHIALYSRDERAANAAFSRAWDVIHEIDRQLTNFSPDSELNQLCRSAPHQEPVRVGRHLWTVLVRSDALSRKTAGAFDVTIGPISKLWRRARTKKELPDPDVLAQARSAVGYQLVQLHQQTQTVRLTRPGMQLDLGGIAKGYAVDQGLAAIRRAGIESALINGGGDIGVTAPPPNKDAWSVEIAGLDPTQHRLTIGLANRAVATSGDAWQYLQIGNTRYSHLIDPRTGIGTTRRITATVIAPSCIQADSLASVLCMLPPADGIRFVEQQPSVSARLIRLDDSGEPQVFYAGDFPQSGGQPSAAESLSSESRFSVDHHPKNARGN